MNVIFVNVPKTGGEVFEHCFDGKSSRIQGKGGRVYSVGHSWSYPTKIKGWLDWDEVNSVPGKYNDVMTYSIPPSTNVATIVRNPFHLLIDYFNEDWAWCKKYQIGNIDFQSFVDAYLDESIGFHVPAFKKSLFSQLKNQSGKWIIDSKSFVLRYEQLTQDINIFSKMTNIPLPSISKISINKYELESYYREDQIVKLTKLWRDDLEYLGYLSELSKYDIPHEGVVEVKKPKIAICFSGLIRDLDYTKDFWLDLIDRYDIDVYASFWDTETPEINDTIENFKSIYNVKELEVEKYSNFKKSTLDVVTHQITPPNILLPELIKYAKEFHTLSMWYKIWKCNMLTKNSDVQYDVVIRARTDSYLEGDFEILKNNMFNVPVGRVYTDNMPKSEGINDIFGYGNPKVMDYVSSTFLYLLRYLNEGHYMIPPEHFLHVHLNEVDLDIRFFANKLIITRKSMGRDDELYNRNTDVIEEIQPSNFINPIPNKDINWTTPLRNSLKF